MTRIRFTLRAVVFATVVICFTSGFFTVFRSALVCYNGSEEYADEVIRRRLLPRMFADLRTK